MGKEMRKKWERNEKEKWYKWENNKKEMRKNKKNGRRDGHGKNKVMSIKIIQ